MWPAMMTMPPNRVALNAPMTRSASQPPSTLSRYTEAPYVATMARAIDCSTPRPPFVAVS